MSEHVVILKTGRLHEFEMGCNALKESGIPHFRQEETVSGLKTSMVVPVMAPGLYWNLFVPVSEKTKAEKILSDLPIDFTVNPDLWHCGSKPESQQDWKGFIALIVLTSVAILAYNLFKLLGN